ncbi:MAG TPA: hypothetical protein VHQ47_17745 [Phycisphaerae bacterium]|nr:hypothetical protein [Phycisphaerae bacterium]
MKKTLSQQLERIETLLAMIVAEGMHARYRDIHPRRVEKAFAAMNSELDVVALLSLYVKARYLDGKLPVTPASAQKKGRPKERS